MFGLPHSDKGADEDLFLFGTSCPADGDRVLPLVTDHQGLVGMYVCMVSGSKAADGAAALPKTRL